MINASFENLPTARVVHQVNYTRARFNRHPLYRRWSLLAYDNRLALFAERFSEEVVKHLPLVIFLLPFVLIAIAAFFGMSIITLVMTILGIIFGTLAMVIAALVPAITAGTAAGSILFEREAGRWDLLMMIPYDRFSVLVMRIASVVHPYHPLLDMLKLLQMLSALIAVLTVNVLYSAENPELMTAFFMLTIPCFFIMNWERKQDYAVSLVIGALGGTAEAERQSMNIAFGGTGLMLGFRLVLGMVAFGLAPVSSLIGIPIATFIGGAAVLPALGLPLIIAIPLMVVYYGIREIVIYRVWQFSQRNVTTTL